MVGSRSYTVPWNTGQTEVAPDVSPLSKLRHATGPPRAKGTKSAATILSVSSTAWGSKVGQVASNQMRERLVLSGEEKSGSETGRRSRPRVR